METKSLTTEASRTYTWANGAQVVIDNPLTLSVSKSGHRITDKQRHGHYIQNGWIHLSWVAKPGAPVMSF